MRQISNLQLSGNNVLNWFFQVKTKSLIKEPFYIKTTLHSHIFNVFSEIKESNESEIKIDLKQFNKKDYQDSSFADVLSVQEILKKSKEDFAHFLIHGSTSDLRISEGWSDFDSIAVIKDRHRNAKQVCHLLDICMLLDKEMRKIDKLQHHGIHFIHEKELKSYPQLYLPYQLFSDSKCLLGTKKISINPICSRSLELKRFKGIVKTFKDAKELGFLNHHPLDGVYLQEDFQNERTMYQLKYFLSVIMLLPTLWFNLKDVYCKKSDSFKMLEKHYNKEELEILEKSSLIRSKWDDSDISENKIPTWVQEELGLHYLRRGYKFAKMLEDSL